MGYIIATVDCIGRYSRMERLIIYERTLSRTQGHFFMMRKGMNTCSVTVIDVQSEISNIEFKSLHNRLYSLSHTLLTERHESISSSLGYGLKSNVYRAL